MDLNAPEGTTETFDNFGANHEDAYYDYTGRPANTEVENSHDHND